MNTTRKKLAIYFSVISTLICFFTFVDVKSIKAITETKTVTVSATVPNLISSVEKSISIEPSNTINPQSKVNIVISYRNISTSNLQYKIKVLWGKGRIESTGHNNILTWQYIDGSATSTQEGTIPQIDLIDQSITWNIQSLAPSSEFKTVRFSLYADPEFPIHKSIFSDLTLENYVDQNPQIIDTETIEIKYVPNTSTEVSNNNASTSLSETPGFKIDYVDILKITDKDLDLIFKTSKPSKISIFLRASNGKFQKISSTDLYQQIHKSNLSDLIPFTNYEFYIEAVDSSGVKIASSIYEFKTSSEGVAVNADLVQILWKNILLNNKHYESIVVSTDQNITLDIKEIESAYREITAYMIPYKVLGAESWKTSVANLGSTKLIEVFPGHYRGELSLLNKNGDYSIYLELKKADSSLSKVTLPYKIIVDTPIQILESNSNLPVENATVKIMFWEQINGRYVQFEQGFNYNNKTNQKGNIELSVSPGKYKIHVTAAGYKDNYFEGYIGTDQLKYPKIYLERRSDIAGIFEYYISAIKFADYSISSTGQSYLTSSLIKDVSLIIITIFFGIGITFLIYIENIRNAKARYKIILFISTISAAFAYTGVLIKLISIHGLKNMTGHILLTLIFFVIVVFIFTSNMFRKKEQ